jgi:hypothetical protein
MPTPGGTRFFDEGRNRFSDFPHIQLDEDVLAPLNRFPSSAGNVITTQHRRWPKGFAESSLCATAAAITE